MCWKTLGSSPGGGKILIFLFSTFLGTLLGGQRSLIFNGYRGSSLGVKRPGRDTTHLHIVIYSYTFTAPVCLHRVMSDSFTFQ